MDMTDQYIAALEELKERCARRMLQREARQLAYDREKLKLDALDCVIQMLKERKK